MGCGSSKTISFSPVRRRSEVPLDKADILRGFGDVGRLLAQQRVQGKVILLGSALNVIHLETQPTLSSVIVMDDLMSKEARAAMAHAAGASRKLHSKLPLDWLSTSGVQIGPNIRQRAVHEAQQQNLVVFQQGGLTAYAASWRYLFVAELDRLCQLAGDGGRTLIETGDAVDAAQYLQQELALGVESHIEVDRITSWQSHYGFESRDDTLGVLAAVDATFGQLFGRRPVRKPDKDLQSPNPAPLAMSL